MKTENFNEDAMEIEVGLFFTIQRDSNGKIFIVTFDTKEQCDSYIENVCVSMGEDGHKDNFIYQSNYDKEFN